MGNYGNNIKKIRELRNLTQKYIAENIGMSQGNYARLENGEIQISADRMKSIADLLKCDEQKIKDFNLNAFFMASNNGELVSKTTQVENLQNLMISDDLKKMYEDRIKFYEKYIERLEEMLDMKKEQLEQIKEA